MLEIRRTNSENTDFAYLIKLLDKFLKVTDGDEHDFYNQFNNIDVLKHIVVIYSNNKPVGCGAFKEYNSNTIEIKRMFTHEEFRNQGVASKTLKALEDWAIELNYSSSIIETGVRQIEAVQFYKNKDYLMIPNYGQYENRPNSICFEKELTKNEKRQ